MKKSFVDWIKLKEQQMQQTQQQPNQIGKKDDKNKIKTNIKNALVNSMKSKQDPAKALANVAQQAAMDPNIEPDELLDVKKVVDKLDKNKMGPK